MTVDSCTSAQRSYGPAVSIRLCVHLQLTALCVLHVNAAFLQAHIDGGEARGADIH